MSIPAVQKQYQLLKAAKGFKLQLVNAPVAPPLEGQVLVRVHACSLNRRDIMVARGLYPTGKPEGLVPLSDGAGEVAAVGSKVSRFKVGDRVAASFFQNWYSGRSAADTMMSGLGGAVDGMLSQYVTLSEQGVVKLPDYLSFDEAATLPCAAVTAWSGLMTHGRMQSGENVLLLGTGGVSVFGLQIAKAAGANTVMTSSSDTKLAQAQKLGATHTVNYRTNPEWDVAVKKATGVGVHHVLEIGGAGTLQKSLASLANGGHIAVIGGLSSNYGDLSTMALLGKNASITGITVGSRAEFEALLKFMTEHRIKPVIDRHFEYFNAEAAYEYMDSGSHFSKIVIRM